MVEWFLNRMNITLKLSRSAKVFNLSLNIFVYFALVQCTLQFVRRLYQLPILTSLDIMHEGCSSLMLCAYLAQIVQLSFAKSSHFCHLWLASQYNCSCLLFSQLSCHQFFVTCSTHPYFHFTFPIFIKNWVCSIFWRCKVKWWETCFCFRSHTRSCSNWRR